MITRLGGRYQLVRELGGGGQARVYQAVDTETGKPVAAKVMLAGNANNLDALLRFQQEGALLSTLRHPNIVEVYGTFLEGDSSSIIMELLEGQPLSEILRNQRIPLDRVKRLMCQVASALAFAHERGIIHRDIKPNNIMVIGDDRVKVTDFGIARVLHPGATLNTATGVSIGTPLYMAPEQIEGLKVDTRADIYSLGAVLYQIVTGQTPFEGDDPFTIAYKHVHKAPPPPSEIGPVPPDWEALILKSLAKSPNDRFQTASELESALEALGTDDPGEVRAYSQTPTLPPVALPQHNTVERLGVWEPQATTHSDAPVNGAIAQTDLPATRVPQTAPSLPPEPLPEAKAEPVPVTKPPESRGTRRLFLIGIPIAAAVVLLAGALVVHALSTPKPSIAQVFVNGSRQGGSYVSGQLVVLGWSNVPNSQYHLQVFALPGDPSNGVDLNRPTRSVLLQRNRYALGVVGAQTYYWRVQVMTGSTWSPYTSLQRFAVAQPIIGKPRVISPTNGATSTATRMQLCWRSTSGAVGYVVNVSRLGSQSTQSTCAWLYELRPGTYRWDVAARVAGARVYTGPTSTRRTFTILRPITKPLLASPVNGTTSTVRHMELCWRRVIGAAGYVLNVSGRTSRHVRGTCAWVGALRPATYHWSVAARVREGRIYMGPFSAPWAFTIYHKTVAQPAPTSAPAATTVPAPVSSYAPTVAPQIQPTAVPAPAQVQPQPVAPPPAQAQPTVAKNPAPCDPSVQVCS